MISEAEFERLALEAETEEQIDALVKRAVAENGWPEIACYTTVELIRAEAEGREPMVE